MTGDWASGEGEQFAASVPSSLGGDGRERTVDGDGAWGAPLDDGTMRDDGASGGPLDDGTLHGDGASGPLDDGTMRGESVAVGRAAAFFDLDRTLMAGSSGIFFAKAAFETGMISRRRLAKDVFENVRFRLRGSTDDRADAVRIRVGEMISGVAVRELQRLAPRVLAGVLPRLYPEMLAKAWAHQDEGFSIYIVTAASQEMADLLAHVLAFDGGVGSRSEVVDGVYTGRADGPFNYREGKRTALAELAAREQIDLAASFAYSDSESDLPMLRAVGHPIAVNPDAELTRVAREEGWEVLRLDHLSRRLKLAGAITVAGATAAIVGSAAGAAAVRELPRARRSRAQTRSARPRRQR